MCVTFTFVCSMLEFTCLTRRALRLHLVPSLRGRDPTFLQLTLRWACCSEHWHLLPPYSVHLLHGEHIFIICSPCKRYTLHYNNISWSTSAVRSGYSALHFWYCCLYLKGLVESAQLSAGMCSISYENLLSLHFFWDHAICLLWHVSSFYFRELWQRQGQRYCQGRSWLQVLIIMSDVY